MYPARDTFSSNLMFSAWDTLSLCDQCPGKACDQNVTEAGGVMWHDVFEAHLPAISGNLSLVLH